MSGRISSRNENRNNSNSNSNSFISNSNSFISNSNSKRFIRNSCIDRKVPVIVVVVLIV